MDTFETFKLYVSNNFSVNAENPILNLAFQAYLIEAIFNTDGDINEEDVSLELAKVYKRENSNYLLESLLNDVLCNFVI